MEHSLYNRRNIAVALVFHKKDMHIFQFFNRFPPIQAAKACRTYDEAVKHDLIICQAGLNILDYLVKLDLLVSRPFVL